MYVYTYCRQQRARKNVDADSSTRFTLVYSCTRTRVQYLRTTYESIYFRKYVYSSVRVRVQRCTVQYYSKHLLGRRSGGAHEASFIDRVGQLHFN